MKNFLKASFNHDQIDKINKDELKKALEGDHMLGRMKYRRQVGNFIGGKRQKLQKGEILKQELAQAEHIDEKQKHPLYGFKCLHYSVSEASGSIMIHLNNKSGDAGKVRIQTIDQEAKAGTDYEGVDEVLEFKQGETQSQISVKINDDDNWEPDRDFFVQLLDANTNEELSGKDTRTRVTIIDDDQPGQIAFED